METKEQVTMRKNSSEISKLVCRVEIAGYTLVPLNLHFKNSKIKLEIGLVKGKKQHETNVKLKRNMIGNVNKAEF
jgi:tmRNA-binding protein